MFTQINNNQFEMNIEIMIILIIIIKIKIAKEWQKNIYMMIEFNGLTMKLPKKKGETSE